MVVVATDAIPIPNIGVGFFEQVSPFLFDLEYFVTNKTSDLVAANNGGSGVGVNDYSHTISHTVSPFSFGSRYDTTDTTQNTVKNNQVAFQFTNQTLPSFDYSFKMTIIWGKNQKPLL